MEPAENCHGPDRIGPVSFQLHPGIVDIEGYLVTAPDGIDLVTLPGSVEIDPAGSLLVKIIDGKSIGIALISGQSQGSPFFLLQHFQAFLRRECLFETPHGTKHGISSFV